MTDESTDVQTDTAEPEADASETAVATETIEPETAPPEPEAVSFWHRPNVERYFLPLAIPVVAVIGVVLYVLNVSRVFLSGTTNIAVVVCSTLLVTILVGATILSNASRLRSTSIALATAAYVLVVVMGGWLVLGHSEQKETGGGTLPVAGPSIGEIKIVSAPTGGLTFAPASLSAKTGIYKVILTNGAAQQHTLDFDDATALFPGLVVNNKGEKQEARIFFGTQGDYTFYCAIAGHRAAGMQGVIHVTGPPMTLQQAEAAAAK